MIWLYWDGRIHPFFREDDDEYYIDDLDRLIKQNPDVIYFEAELTTDV